MGDIRKAESEEDMITAWEDFHHNLLYKGEHIMDFTLIKQGGYKYGPVDTEWEFVLENGKKVIATYEEVEIEIL